VVIGIPSIRIFSFPNIVKSEIRFDTVLFPSPVVPIWLTTRLDNRKGKTFDGSDTRVRIGKAYVSEFYLALISRTSSFSEMIFVFVFRNSLMRVL